MFSNLEKREVLTLPVNYNDLTSYDRREIRKLYENLQNGNCCHCHEPLDGEPPSAITNLHINWDLFPKHFMNNPVHLHHNHNTGLTIGSAHAYCNAVLWQYYGE